MRSGMRASLPRYGLNVVRGALIGTAETVPGVSGGTVALIVRVYDTVISSAGHLVSGVLRGGRDLPGGRGWSRAADEFRQVRWQVIVPLLLGMVAAVLLVARLMGSWVADSPILSRALFFGLVLASLWVPISLVTETRGGAGGSGRWGWRDGLVAVAAAAVAYFLVSLPPGDLQASAPVIVLAAAVAVSALILPGLSGSFLLLTIGLYQPTLSAVNDRDVAYLSWFLLGALIGLTSIVKLLQWLLTHRRRGTLVILTGLMAGSLRALWPWQTEARDLLAPGDHLGAAIGLMMLGFTVVGAVLVVERRVQAGRSD